MTEQAATYLDTIVERIKTYGWAVQCVGGATPEESFSYTAGLTARGVPELWLATLAPQQAAGLINAAARLLVDGAVTADTTGPVDVGYSVPVRFRGPLGVDDTEAFVARALSEVEPVVVQVLWPDEAGLFPDEDGYDTARFPQRLVPLAGVAG